VSDVPAEKVDFTGVRETLLATLYAGMFYRYEW
jgi:hypothetical protein